MPGLPIAMSFGGTRPNPIAAVSGLPLKLAAPPQPQPLAPATKPGPHCGAKNQSGCDSTRCSWLQNAQSANPAVRSSGSLVDIRARGGVLSKDSTSALAPNPRRPSKSRSKAMRSNPPRFVRNFGMVAKRIKFSKRPKNKVGSVAVTKDEKFGARRPPVYQT